MRRRFLVPEVVQTSAMDCGPAALKALFGGFGIYLSYGRLREACQTDVDGTSIDTLEDLAQRLGLNVAQTMMPADLVLLETSACLPAIVIMRLPDGAPHFVVLWNLAGPFAQIMDPAVGRIWVNKQRFLESLYIHEQPVPRATAEEWAQSETFASGLEYRLRALGVDSALWEDRIHLDASLRLAHAMPRSHRLSSGKEAREFLELCRANPEQIPNEFWSLRSIESATDQLQMRGAVLIAAAGIRKEATQEQLPDSLVAVLTEPPPRVWNIAWSAIAEGGLLPPGIVSLALVAIALGTAFEVILFRCMLDLGANLRLRNHRLTAVGVVLLLLFSLLALNGPPRLVFCASDDSWKCDFEHASCLRFRGSATVISNPG